MEVRRPLIQSFSAQTPGPRSSGDRAPPSGGGSAGSNPAGGASKTPGQSLMILESGPAAHISRSASQLPRSPVSKATAHSHEGCHQHVVRGQSNGARARSDARLSELPGRGTWSAGRGSGDSPPGNGRPSRHGWRQDHRAVGHSSGTKGSCPGGLRYRDEVRGISVPMSMILGLGHPC